MQVVGVGQGEQERGEHQPARRLSPSRPRAARAPPDEGLEGGPVDLHHQRRDQRHTPDRRHRGERRRAGQGVPHVAPGKAGQERSPEPFRGRPHRREHQPEGKVAAPSQPQGDRHRNAPEQAAPGGKQTQHGHGQGRREASVVGDGRDQPRQEREEEGRSCRPRPPKARRPTPRRQCDQEGHEGHEDEWFQDASHGRLLGGGRGPDEGKRQPDRRGGGERACRHAGRCPKPHHRQAATVRRGRRPSASRGWHRWPRPGRPVRS